MQFVDRATRRRWYTAPKNEVHDAIAQAIRTLDNAQSARREQNLHHLRLYSNFAALGLSGSSYAIPEGDGRLKMNVVKAVIDAMVAKIGTIRPRPLYLTEKGNFALQQRAKNLNKFTAGQFYWLRQYKLGRRIFKDAAIFGTGFEHVYADHKRKKICIERVFPDEMLIDDLECRYGEPRQMFRYKELSKDALAGLYPKFASDIYNSAPMRDREAYSVADGITDATGIAEAWFLPSTPGAKDGRHVLCVSTKTLVDEPWERDRFPFGVMRLSDRPLGFFGAGLAEELSEIQLEINFICQKLQALMTLLTTQMWARKGSINPGTVSNEEGTINFYRDEPPVVITPQVASPEHYAQLDRLWQRAFDLAGVSELSATGRKPQGLNSGIAIRSQQDVESQRFLDVQQSWEDFNLDVSELMIDAARDLDEYCEGGYSLMARGDKSLEKLDFKDVDLERDKYILRCWPTNFLPATPAGKLQTLQDFAQIAPELTPYLLREMDFPDLDAAVAMATSHIDMADMLIEAMLERGEYRPPEAFMNLQLSIQRMQAALLRADVEGAPEDKLEMLRRWISEAQGLLAPPEPPPMPAQMQPQPQDMMQAEAMPPGAAMAPGAQGMPV